MSNTTERYIPSHNDGDLKKNSEMPPLRTNPDEQAQRERQQQDERKQRD